MAPRWSKEAISRRLVDALELPRDIALDLPKVTLVGNLQVFVENHRGIIEYRPDEVRINSSRGEIVIAGSRLAIGTISRAEVVVEGRISGVALRDWGGD
ncbi:MAG: sporulation protein YqfC [Bacillota bacterium]|nr:sporulation protein YqfC [Bacillota bacterium]